MMRNDSNQCTTETMISPDESRRLTSAEADVIEAFEGNFAFLKNEPVVLYGIGDKTKAILEHCKAHNIVGLMDKNSAGCLVYGKKVLSPREAAGVCTNIVIVSNYASAELIYRRIAHLEQRHGILIYHLNGTKPGAVYGENGRTPAETDAGLTYAGLRSLIDLHDVISFDLFDTLLLRKCLLPGDIFQIVERRLEERYGIRINFAQLRIEAERTAYREWGHGFGLDDIYQAMAFGGVSQESLELARALEIEAERESLIPRGVVVEAMRYAKERKKLVALTSDTYFSSEVIEGMLQAHDIAGYDLLTLSCEVKKSKSAGDLWRQYEETFRGKRLLHIGDDAFADVRQAEAHGITPFRICSPSELCRMSPLGDLADKANSLDDRIMLGCVYSKLFNDPFVLARFEKLALDDFYTAGYAFWGPLVLKFMQWLFSLAPRLKLRKVLFLSRDGFLLDRLYRKYADRFGAARLPEAIYFLTSRRALSVSSIEDVDGVIDVFKSAPYVTRINVDRFLRATFGVAARAEDPYRDRLLYDVDPEDLLRRVIAGYADEILKAAGEERDRYLRYFASLGIERSERIGVVNFVSGGITQHFFEKIFDCPRAFFLYFATRVDFGDVPTKNEVFALYGSRLSPYSGKANSLIKYYLTAESVFSSPDEQFVKFSSDGRPVFETADEARDFSGIDACHRGIDSFLDEMTGRDQNIAVRDFSAELADACFGSFFGKDGVVLSNEIKRALHIRDGFAPDAVVQTITE